MRIISTILLLVFGSSLAQAELNGKQAYMKSCVQCHSANGSGGKDFGQGPNLTILKKKYAKEQFDAILQGKRKGPGTVNMMKVLKESKLSDKELAAAFDYSMKLPKVRANHKGFGNAKIGKTQYNAKCTHCHGAKAKGYQNPGLPSPALAGQADFYIVDMLKSFKSGHRGNSSPASMQMKAMSMTVANEKEMKDIAAYLRSFDKPKSHKFEDLTYKVYKGSWDKLPDFSKLKPVKNGTLPNGKLDIRVAEVTENFAVVFDGFLDIPQEGKYRFHLYSDDGAKLFVDGKMVADNDGLHPMQMKKSKSLKLKQGRITVQVQYFEKGGDERLALEWLIPGSKKPHVLSEYAPVRSGIDAKTYVLESKEDEAMVFRNFFSGTSSRGIAVAYPEKTHIMYNASNMSLAYFWRGGFVNASKMWSGRGTKFIDPDNNEVKVCNDIQVAFLPKSNTEWPVGLNRKSSEVRKSDLRFRGYKLDKKRYPTFMYTLKDVKFEDFFSPVDEGIGIKRTVIANSAGNPSNLWFRVTVDKIEKQGDQFLVNDEYLLKAEGAQLRPYGKVHELLIPFKFNNSQSKIEITYLFAEGGEES